MTQVIDQVSTPSAGGSGPKKTNNSIARQRKRNGATFVPLVLQLMAMVGIGALVYSSGADWVSRLHHGSQISGYAATVKSLPTAHQQQLLQQAYDYNAQLQPGVLRDPYLQNASGVEGERDSSYQTYLNVLSVGEEHLMGNLSYPDLRIALPIYHGTSDQTLRKGVGHLFGSSLPVGGDSTHSVLTSHSGQASAKLFDPLLQADLGDVFTVRVLGQTLYYQVVNIQTVVADDTDKLQIADGRDQVTLVTCTPIGVNSHRLLVTGERIPEPEMAGARAIGGPGLPGFPWWFVIFLGASAMVAAVVFAPPGRGKNRNSAVGRAPRPE